MRRISCIRARVLALDAAHRARAVRAADGRETAHGDAAGDVARASRCRPTRHPPPPPRGPLLRVTHSKWHHCTDRAPAAVHREVAA
eukprot:1449482-Prymnesium_polylepis.3